MGPFKVLQSVYIFICGCYYSKVSQSVVVYIVLPASVQSGFQFAFTKMFYAFESILLAVIIINFFKQKKPGIFGTTISVFYNPNKYSINLII